MKYINVVRSCAAEIEKTGHTLASIRSKAGPKRLKYIRSELEHIYTLY
jgi:hypothetical protein